MKRTLFFAALGWLIATPALADGAIISLIRPADQAKLDRFDRSRSEALQQVERKGSTNDYKAAKKLLATTPRPLKDFDLTGNWQCRTTKLGGDPAYTPYGWFRCRVTDDGAGWLLTKLSGSQRTQGYFYTASDTQLHYLGSVYVAGEKPLRYSDPKAVTAVGVATRTGASSWRIEIPQPPYESRFDVMEFRRGRR